MASLPTTTASASGWLSSNCVAAEFYAGITDFGFIRPGDLEFIGAPIDFLGIN